MPNKLGDYKPRNSNLNYAKNKMVDNLRIRKHKLIDIFSTPCII